MYFNYRMALINFKMEITQNNVCVWWHIVYAAAVILLFWLLAAANMCGFTLQKFAIVKFIHITNL